MQWRYIYRIESSQLRLTTFTDYSLRVLLFLAADPSRRVTIREIADTFNISENHLMKVAHLLGKKGLLANVRGKGGGLQLAKPPRTINIGRVVRATEGPPLPAECFDREHNRCVITPVCSLRGVLREAVRDFYAVLDRYSLEDLVRNRRAPSEGLFAGITEMRGRALRSAIRIEPKSSKKGLGT